MKIPTIEPSGSSDTGPAGPQATLTDFNYGIGDQGRQLAGGIDKVGDGLMSVYDQYSTVQAQNKISQAQVDWLGTLQKAKESGNGGSINTADMMQKFNDYTDTVASSDGMTPKASQLFREHMQEFGVHVYQHSLAIEAKGKVGDALSTAQNNYSALQGVVGSDASALPTAMSTVAMGAPAHPQAGTPVATNDTNAKQAGLVTSAVDGSLTQSNWPGAEQIINDPNYSQYLSPEYKAATQDTVALQKKVQTNLDLENLASLRSANMKSLQETGQPADGYNMAWDASVHAKTPDKAKEIYDKLTDAKNASLLVYQAKTATIGKPYEDGVAALNALKPDAGDPNYKLKFAAWQQGVTNFNDNRKLMNTDPFAYAVKGDPSISYFQQKAQDAAASGDNQGSVNFQNIAINRALDIQRSAGVPEERLAVIDSAGAADLSNQIQQGTQTQGIGALQEIAQKYGANADKVFQSMQNLPEGKGRLPVSYQVVASNLDNPQLATTMLNAVRNNSANKATLEGSKTSSNDQLEFAVNTDPDMAAYRDAMNHASPEGLKYANEVAETAKSLARQYAVTGGSGGSGLNAQDAATNAVKAVIKTQYGMQKNPDQSNFAIPAKAYTPDQQNAMGGYLRKAITHVGENGLMLVGNEAIPIDPSSINPGISEKDDVQSKLLYNSVKDNAYWVTNPQGDGVQLLFNTPDGRAAGSRGVAVKSIDGKPISMKYSSALAQVTKPKMDLLDLSGINKLLDFTSPRSMAGVLTP